MNKDLYKILGISKESSQEDIKKAYRKLALKYHPDKNKGDKKSEEKFKEISDAYRILSDEKLKRKYDSNGNSIFDFDIDEMMREEFNGSIFSVFNNFNRQNQHHKQRNIHVDMSVSLDDILKGSEKTVSYNVKRICKKCDGNKTTDKNGIVICSKCKGSGKLSVRNNIVSINVPCPDCGGKGRVLIKPCEKCEGKGYEISREKLKLKVPVGCPNGYKITMNKKGHEYEKNKYGDLSVIIYSADHPIYKRINNQDILIELPIPIHVSIIGSKLEIPTIHGKKTINIPQGIRDGQRIVYNGLGLPIMNTNSFGDMYIISRLEVPDNISDEIKQVLSNIPIEEKSYPMYINFMNIA